MSSLWFDAEIDLWPLVMGILLAVSCGLLGTVFLLRRVALLGDAVSHSVLPGVGIGLLAAHAFLGPVEDAFGASVSMLFVLAGALLAGLAATALIEAFHRYSRIKPDTALGAVFPAFFALGVVLIEVAAQGAHFDVDCVFFGALENIASFRAVLPTLACTVLVVLCAALAYREILVGSFDRALAASLGLPVRWIDRVLVALLVATVVTAFSAVGAILVVAFLVIPPATARLLSDRFHIVLVLAAVLGASAAFFGAWLTILLAHESIGLETLRAPTMAVAAGLQFLLALLFAPGHGLLMAKLRQLRLEWRIHDENALGALYRLESSEMPALRGETRAAVRPTVEEIAASIQYRPALARRALARCRARGEIRREGRGFALEARGRERVAELIRAHRLWEMYLTEELGAASDRVHDAADRMEHHLQPALVRDLDRLLGHPSRDPHGREIPPPQPVSSSSAGE